jgi:hypothetical protein
MGTGAPLELRNLLATQMSTTFQPLLYRKEARGECIGPPDRIDTRVKIFGGLDSYALLLSYFKGPSRPMCMYDIYSGHRQELGSARGQKSPADGYPFH